MPDKTVSAKLRPKVPDHYGAVLRSAGQLLQIRFENDAVDGTLVATKRTFKGRVEILQNASGGRCLVLLVHVHVNVAVSLMWCCAECKQVVLVRCTEGWSAGAKAQAATYIGVSQSARAFC